MDLLRGCLARPVAFDIDPHTAALSNSLGIGSSSQRDLSGQPDSTYPRLRPPWRVGRDVFAAVGGRPQDRVGRNGPMGRSRLVDRKSGRAFGWLVGLSDEC